MLRNQKTEEKAEEESRPMKWKGETQKGKISETES